MRPLLYIIPVLLLSACSSRPDALQNHELTVSVEPQRYLLEQIAGDKWNVTTLMSRGEDPENFDPTLSDLRRLHSSRAYFRIGTLAFEDEIVERSGGSLPTVDTGKGILRLEGTHGECHDHHHRHDHDESHVHEYDPHIWASIPNLKLMAANMLEAMIETDPADSALYRTNYLRLSARLDSCQTAIDSILSPDRGVTFMVWHPSLSYFARDYGLKQLTIGMSNKEMSVAAFRHKIDDARQRGANLFLLQSDFDAGRSASIASAAGASSLTVNTLAYDLPSELLRIARQIKYTRQ